MGIWCPTFFFPCIAERARGMVGQLSRNAKAKKGETGITCRSLSTGLESRTKPQPNKQHQQTNTKTREEPVKILAKRVKRFAPPGLSSHPTLWCVHLAIHVNDQMSVMSTSSSPCSGGSFTSGKSRRCLGWYVSISARASSSLPRNACMKLLMSRTSSTRWCL